MKHRCGKMRMIGISVMVFGMAAAMAAEQIAPGGPGQVQSPRWPPRDRYKGVPLELTAKREGKPALEYVLLPPAAEIRKGNAAVKYLMGLQNLPKLSEQAQAFLSEARTDAPLAELSEQDPAVQEILKLYGSSSGGSLRFFHDGARLDHADWGTNLRQEGYRTLLPSLGGIRQMSKMLQFQIRLDIKRHDWAAAREKLQTGYALSLHLAEGDTLIESLVGIANAAGFTTTLEDWVSEPDAPNLYWALANLPAPLNDLRRPFHAEMALAEFSFPAFKEMEAGRYSAENWSRLMTQLGEAAPMFGTSGGILPRPEDEQWKQQFVSTGLGLMLYPDAKKYLIGTGMPPQVVAKMPVPEVLGRYFVLSYRTELDNAMKWAGLPASQAVPAMKAWQDDLQQRSQQGEVNFLVNMLLPSLAKAKTLSTRVDRQIAMLRIVEAMRQYAADKGTLPPRLEDLTLPVPLDPKTGKAFDYTLKDGVAKLVSEDSDLNERFEYDISLRK